MGTLFDITGGSLLTDHISRFAFKMRKLISALAVFISIASCVPSSDSSDDKLSVNDASRFSDSYIRDLGNSDLPAALDLVDEGEDKGIFSSFDANLLRSKLI